MYEMINLTSEQWARVDEEVKVYVKMFVSAFNNDLYGNGEIHPDYDGGLEQREYFGSYFRTESVIEDIIQEVTDNEELHKYNIEGFHDLMISFETLTSEALPDEWFIYFDDGDIWVARRWDNEELLKELHPELEYLISE
jgi:hypothetical protein